MYKMSSIVLATLFFGCSPKVVTSSMKSNLPSRVDLYYEPFALIEKDTFDRTASKFIGQIEIKDSGFTLSCDYETVKKMAKEEALKLGGNCLVIKEHREPNAWSTCHRIKADVFSIEDPKKYETEVIWNEKRKLEISDFKGSTENRPFTAATSSSIRYRVEGRPAFPNKYKVFVETFFICHFSYFKRTELDSQVLAHEQIHFDISELYSRKFVEKIEREALNLNQFLARQEAILNEIGQELQRKQDEYDAEVYGNRSKQLNWDNWIQEELKKYEKYASKVLIVQKEK